MHEITQLLPLFCENKVLSNKLPILTVSAETPGRPKSATARSKVLAFTASNRFWPALVLAVATVAGVLNYVQFLQAPERLWWSTIHDRNAHFLLGLNFATDIRTGDVTHFLRDFDSTRVWGPLYGLTQAVVMSVFGLRYEWAVAPSAVSWILSVLFGFLLARRLTTNGGVLAGLIAATFILTSLPHRAFASDIMIEGPGACLTLVVLYFAVCAYQDRSVRSVRCLGASMTALFALKYNYWILVAMAMIANEAFTRRREILPFVRSVSGSVAAMVIVAELRRPLTWFILLVAGLAAAVSISGGGVVHLLGQRISIRSNHNLIQLAYMLCFVRGVLWWRSGGHQWICERVERAPRQFIYWHLWPVAAWFLLPKRLGFFLWYVGPNHGENRQHDRFGGYAAYFQWLATEYHGSVIAVCCVLALVGVTVLLHRRLKPGVQILLWFVLISAILTANHSNRKARFLHSWVAGVWVLAGVGLAQGLSVIRTSPRVRPLLAAGALVGLAAIRAPLSLENKYAGEGGPKQNALISLELSDAYLPALAESQRVTILSNMPQKQFDRWTYLARYGRKATLATEVSLKDETAPLDRATIEHWLQSTDSDTIVYIDYEEAPVVYGPLTPPDHSHLRLALEGQSGFLKARRWDFPQHRCGITLWTRSPAVFAAASQQSPALSADGGSETRNRR